MKRVLSVQDLSCVGKCSLSVALPVLSAMGCACSVLPTAVLSTHTAFPKPRICDLTAEIRPICDHWQTIGAEFDAVTVGYLSDPAQAEAVSHLLDCFGKLVVLDPAMGDHGKRYSGITEGHVQAMEALCRKSRILLPNVTEAALLTGLPYREKADTDYYRELAEGMLTFGADAAVITDVCLQPGKTGFYGFHRENGPFSYQARQIPRSFHGTGDLFSAVLTGGLMNGLDLPEAARLAAGFVEKSIGASAEVTPFGVAFEQQLPWLWQKLQGGACCSCPGY